MHGLPVSSFPVPASFLRGRVLLLPPGLPRKITSTCNSVATCNASLARYRKRHSRPLVTTALKRRSIFRRCVCVSVSPVLYSMAIEPLRGPLSLSSVSSFAARYLMVRSEGGLPLLFFVAAFRPSTARLVPVSSSRDFKASTVSLAIRSSVYSRHCKTKAAPYLFLVPPSIHPRSPPARHHRSSSTHSVSV